MHLKKRFKNTEGVSLIIVIGLFLLLVMLTTTVSQLVIRALQASRQIESSDKAYFAAEAGIEDALYELSAHSAGYTTPLRSSDFTEEVDWNNEWFIANGSYNDCANFDSWEDWGPNPYNPNFCGQMRAGEKLTINLFNDLAYDTSVGISGISILPQNISTLGFSNVYADFLFRIRVPNSIVAANGITTLNIDNDGDYLTSSSTGPEGIVGLNEDGSPAFSALFTPAPCPYSGGLAVDDGDCDNREDEDSREDPVILMRLLDDAGNSYQTTRGCMGDVDYTPLITNSTICEKNFTLDGAELAVSFDGQTVGYDQNGNPAFLSNFFGNYTSASSDSLRMELLVVAPMTAVNTDSVSPSLIPIPYYEYAIEYDASGILIPSTRYTISSDGYYRDFKQSITTLVAPEATSRLLNSTIIQQ